MATIPIKVAALESIKDIEIRYYPEAAAQSFVNGDFVYLVNGKVTECSSGDNQILGIAMIDASGTTDTDIPVAVFSVDTRIIMNKTDTSVAAVTAVTDVGAAIGSLYIAQYSAGIWTADVHDYGDACLWVAALHIEDAVGDTGGRLVCGVVPGCLQVDATAIASSVTGLTASINEINAVCDTNTATAAEINISSDLTINGGDGALHSVYKRLTAAQVNAGYTLVTVPVGYKARLVYAGISMEAGAADNLTSIDLKIGATVVQKFLLAGLTDDGYLRRGDATNGVIPANAVAYTTGGTGDDVTIITAGAPMTEGVLFVNIDIAYVIEAV